MVKPLILIIRDGWAIGDPNDSSNAVARANTPNIDSYKKNYPNTRLGCAGEDVGLPAGSQGSSEVGHLNFGAGRIVEQEQVRIDKLIRSGKFFLEPVLLDAMKKSRESGAALHIMGLVQDQGVHAIDRHLFALVEMAAKNGLKKVYVHAFTDGRDTPPRSAKVYLAKAEKEIARIGVGEIASVTGRYYSMDRDRNWDRVEKAYRALVYGEGYRAASAQEAVDQAYARADEVLSEAHASGSDVHGVIETDEFIKPTLVAPPGGKPHTINEGDSVIFFNYRQDRAIELTKAFVEDRFEGFNRPKKLDITFAGLTRYYDEFENYVIPPMNMSKLLGEILSQAGLWQLRTSETQKFAHVTSFFNGKKQEPFPGEERLLIDSPKVPENEKPEMSAPAVGDFCVTAVRDGIAAVRRKAEADRAAHIYPQGGFRETPERLAETYDVIVMNFVNGDMVGHTGDFAAAVVAVETVDRAVGLVVTAALAKGGTVMITADHGNCEQMIDHTTGKVMTSHTLNDVEFILVSEELKNAKLRPRGTLADVAPTMLSILGIAQPREMTGVNLIKRD